MKKFLKIIGLCAFVFVMMKACRMEYYCDVLESIPDSAMMRILEDHPDFKAPEIVEFWENNQDSINHALALESIQHWEERK